jgi:RNA polymerase sigma factor (sigma-70 family)
MPTTLTQATRAARAKDVVAAAAPGAPGGEVAELGPRQHRSPGASATGRSALADEHLVALWRQGEHGAFDTLAARYQTRLLWFCWQILRSKEDAEDALQDVFTSAFNSLLTDEREIQVRPWLYRIARNRCINQLRRTATVGLDSMDEHPADHGRTVVEKLVSRQRFQELVRDVQALPDTQRTALLLREIDGFSYRQIAAAMDTSVPAVKSLLVRARAGLIEATAARETAVEAPAAGPPRRARGRSSHHRRAISYQSARAAASAAAVPDGLRAA